MAKPRTTQSRPSIALILSYILDWIVIIALAAAGGGLNYITPYHRPFSLLDLSISYPYIPELISTSTLVLVSLVAPAIIILLVVALFVPGRAFGRESKAKKGEVLRLKLWEFEKGWAGLALSVALAFFITQGSKNLFGKPRPDFLARCLPDLGNVAAHVVGGYGQDLSARWTLVESSICGQTDSAVLDDGFRSFPSGHSSFSWSGLLYLTLFLCSKFQVTIPYLPLQPSGTSTTPSHNNGQELLPLHHQPDTNDSANKDPTDLNHPPDALTQPRTSAPPISIRNTSAPPPLYLLPLALLPVAVALYICSTRYAQYYHHGFDILSGALIGILTSWGSFRWYHLPIGRGQGWAWGSRSRGRAWGVAVGTGGWVGGEGWEGKGRGGGGEEGEGYGVNGVNGVDGVNGSGVDREGLRDRHGNGFA